MDSYTLYYLLSLLLLPGIVFAIFAQAKINSAYNKYSKISSTSNLTGYEAANRLLYYLGISDIGIIKVKGWLTDYYNSKNRVVAISENNYHSTSIASLGVIAHELGHAEQHYEKYAPLLFRSFFIKLSNFASKFLWPLVIIGVITNLVYADGVIGNIIMIAGVVFFFLSLLLNVITLPVEFNASKRGLKMLTESGIMTSAEELNGVKKVLNAAALTYVAATLISLLEFIRFLILIKSDD